MRCSDRFYRFFFFGLILGALGAGGAAAEDVLEFTYSNPGARSMGLGGAFVALADDATAAFANPAGLVQLARPEVSAELRLTLSEDEYNATKGESIINTSALGFFSFVYPGRGWSLALFTHLSASGRQISRNEDFSLDWDDQAITMNLRSYAAAGAYQVNEKLSLGLGLSYYEGDVGRPPEDLPATDWGISGAGEVKSNDWGFSAGVVWKPSESWKVGGVYRQGVDLKLGFENPVTGPTLLPMNFPASFGLGVSFRPGEGAFTIAAQWDRVDYSTPRPSYALSEPGPGSVSREDGDEFHLGVEYVFLRKTPIIALRFGVWLDPQRRSVSSDLGLYSLQRGNVVHFATGFGWAFKRFQIDLGLDYSEVRAKASASLIYSF